MFFLIMENSLNVYRVVLNSNFKSPAGNNALYFMAGYVMKMNILVPNINQRGQKDLSLKVRHKVYARPLAATKKNDSEERGSIIN